jgi:hypothetical protein
MAIYPLVSYRDLVVDPNFKGWHRIMYFLRDYFAPESVVLRHIDRKGLPDRFRQFYAIIMGTIPVPRCDFTNPSISFT